ncbi:MAG: hypothetical protein Q7T55_11095, partial [Solirubrobacteraceae bacterium]|nr:hypothetical protein [Solirubrobacteraceae bacterium]
AAQLLQAQATALTQQGAASTAISALNSQITGNLGPLANKPPGINVGELLGITQGGASALGTTVNAFDLAAAGVQLANGTNPVAANVVLPAGLTGATSVSLTVGSRPMRVCLGDGKKTMGQTSVTATANILSPGSIVGDLVTSLTGVVNGVLCSVVGALFAQDCYGVPTVSLGPVTARVSLASASGEVTALNCTGAAANSLAVRESASLAPVSVSIPLTISETRTYGPLLNRRTETVTSTFTLVGTTDTIDKSVTATLKVPDDYDTGKAGPSGDLSVPSLRISTSLVTDGKFTNASGTPLVGGILSGVSGVINSIAQRLLTPLLSLAVDPLVAALTTTLRNTVGLTVAGSTYTPLRTPSCGTPALAG